MKVEVLYQEICNLYGEKSGTKYLQQCLPNAEFVYTSLNQTPHFVDNDVSLILLAPMTENAQQIVINKLLPYKDKINQLIDDGVLFICTGNAFEIFLSYIKNEDGSKIDGIGIFDNLYAERKMLNRYNSLYLGEFGGIKIVGYKSQFSQCYGDNSAGYFCKTIRGDGINTSTKLEGVRKNNFIGTYLLGPLLINNPDFTKFVLKTMGAEPNIAFEKTAYENYNARLAEFETPELKF